jgi:GT2 family glycosyltransferase
VFFVPRSNTYNVRQIPDTFWSALSEKIPGSKFWLGTHGGCAGTVDLGARHLDNVVAWLSAADLVVSVDTGPLHIAAALGKPIVALGQSSSPDLHLSDQRDFETVWPEGNLTCLNCQENICRVNYYIPPCQNFSVERVAAKVNQKLTALANADVSAAIAIYQPEAKTLNRCLECLLPQVQEIVVAVDQAGKLPDNALQHGKIRYVHHRLFNIGYGRKMNFATRYTSGRYVLQVNDDVFLNADAVAKMKACMGSGVGVTSCLLRYPDGTIQHAGKVRRAGERGWGHINHKQHIPDFKDVTEQENTCGACWMVDRKAHFDTGGFDERFFIYAEDDDYCLRMRKHGYRILFTPHAEGVHLEHQSTTKTGPIVDHLNNSNRIFGQLWGKYFEHNASRIPGNFDYCKV